MGCFNGTDLLTQLPIRSGDPVRAFVLRPFQSQLEVLPFGPSETTDYYRPVALPLCGRYNDYGWINTIAEDAGAASTRAYFATYHPALGGAAKDVDFLNDLDDVLRELSTDPKMAYGIALVAEPIYHACIAATRATVDYFGLIGDQIDAQINAYLAALVEQSGDIVFQLDDAAPDAYALFHVLTMEIGRGFATYVNAHRHDAAVITAVTDMIVLLRGMRLTRRVLQPQGGQGSQTTSFALHQALLRAALSHAETCARVDADEEEWDDECVDERMTLS